MKKIKFAFIGTSITVTFVAPGVYTFTDGGVLYYILWQGGVPNQGMDDYAGWNILQTTTNYVSIQQYLGDASDFALTPPLGAFANYRELTNAIAAYNAGNVVFGQLVQALVNG